MQIFTRRQQKHQAVRKKLFSYLSLMYFRKHFTFKSVSGLILYDDCVIQIFKLNSKSGLCEYANGYYL